jgi:hypothetical protein
MATLIVLILCGAAAGFLLYCLFHFALERKRRPRRQSDEELWGQSPKSTIVPLQLVGPTSIAFWSRGTWDRFLSIVDDSGSPDVKGDGATTVHYDTAA